MQLDVNLKYLLLVKLLIIFILILHDSLVNDGFVNPKYVVLQILSEIVSAEENFEFQLLKYFVNFFFLILFEDLFLVWEQWVNALVEKCDLLLIILLTQDEDSFLKLL